MNLRRAGSVLLKFWATALLVISFGVGAGCSPHGSTPATSVPSTANSPVNSDTAGTIPTSTTFPSLLSEWDRELARTAEVQHSLGAFLAAQGNKKDDPLLGLYYGLQARTRALTARKALAENNLELADTAMLDVYYSLNLGRNVATGEIAQTLADARALVDTVGAPSDSPKEAAKSLEEFIAALAPLLEQASAVLSSTSST